MLNNKVMLLSHIADPDGVTPVILAKLVYKNLEYKLLNTDEVDENVLKALENENYDEVHLVDLNISDKLAEIIDQNKDYKNKLQVFDHHISGIHLNKYSFITVIDKQNNRKESGSSIYYNYLKSISNDKILNQPSTQELVEQVRLIDTWDFKKEGKEEAKNIDLIFSIYGREEYIKKYLKYLKTHEKFNYSNFDKKLIKLENEKINRYLEQKEKEMAKIKLEGHLVGLVYAERYRSELGNYLISKYDDLDYIALINISKGISYRGNDKVDLSIIAKQRNGGGHKNAAGSPLPNNLLKEITKLIFKDVEWLDDNK